MQVTRSSGYSSFDEVAEVHAVKDFAPHPNWCRDGSRSTLGDLPQDSDDSESSERLQDLVKPMRAALTEAADEKLIKCSFSTREGDEYRSEVLRMTFEWVF